MNAASARSIILFFIDLKWRQARMAIVRYIAAASTECPLGKENPPTFIK